MDEKIKFRIEAPFAPSGDQPPAIKKLSAGLTDGVMYQTLLGVTGSGKTFTIAHVIEELQRPAIILAPNKTLAAQLYAEMREFFPHNAIEYFVSYYDYYQPEAYVPASDTFIEKDASVNGQIEQMRLSATKALLERNDTILVATVSAIYGLGDPRSYFKMVLHLSVGERIDQRELLTRLAEMQYQRNQASLLRGTYQVRGDVVDIFPAESNKAAIRFSLFDDEIESIVEFDPLTNHILTRLPRTTIYPKSHYVTPHSTVRSVIDDIQTELKQRLHELRDQNKLVEAQRLEERVRLDCEMMMELGYCNGIENYSRYLSGREPGKPPPTLFDYLSDNAILFIDESHVTVPQLNAMYRGDRARKENLVNYGFRLPSAMDNRPLQFNELEMLAPQTVYVSATPSDYELEKSQKDVVELVVRPTGLLDPPVEVRPVATQVDDVLSEVTKRAKLQERVLITVLTKRSAEDLTEYFKQVGVRVRYLHSDIHTVERVEIIRDLRLGLFDVLIGINLLREGLDIPEVSLVAILDADKQGFLRSHRSLIQTIGRSARNLNGVAILYGDTITPAMQSAIDETSRRREKQEEYNKKHGITPKGITKKITNILDVSDAAPGEQLIEAADKAQRIAKIQAMTPNQFKQHLAKMEQEMVSLAENLEFENAAKCRDDIEEFRNLWLGMGR